MRHDRSLFTQLCFIFFFQSINQVILSFDLQLKFPDFLLGFGSFDQILLDLSLIDRRKRTLVLTIDHPGLITHNRFLVVRAARNPRVLLVEIERLAEVTQEPRRFRRLDLFLRNTLLDFLQLSHRAEEVRGVQLRNLLVEPKLFMALGCTTEYQQDQQMRLSEVFPRIFHDFFNVWTLDHSLVQIGAVERADLIQENLEVVFASLHGLVL